MIRIMDKYGSRIPRNSITKYSSPLLRRVFLHPPELVELQALGIRAGLRSQASLKRLSPQGFFFERLFFVC